MILWGLRQGDRLHARQLIGLALAAGGLVLLVFPGLSAPSLGGSALMLGAGVAWGIYSLRGKGAKNPISATAGNFLRAVPFAALLSITLFPWARIDRVGLVYAILSGAIASGLGYVIWYTRFAEPEGRQCRHRAAERACPRRRRRNSPARRTAHRAFPARFRRGPGRHRPGRDRETRPRSDSLGKGSLAHFCLCNSRRHC